MFLVIGETREFDIGGWYWKNDEGKKRKREKLNDILKIFVWKAGGQEKERKKNIPRTILETNWLPYYECNELIRKWEKEAFSKSW